MNFPEWKSPSAPTTICATPRLATRIGDCLRERCLHLRERHHRLRSRYAMGFRLRQRTQFPLECTEDHTKVKSLHELQRRLSHLIGFRAGLGKGGFGQQWSSHDKAGCC